MALDQLTDQTAFGLEMLQLSIANFAMRRKHRFDAHVCTVVGDADDEFSHKVLVEATPIVRRPAAHLGVNCPFLLLCFGSFVHLSSVFHQAEDIPSRNCSLFICSAA